MERICLTATIVATGLVLASTAFGAEGQGQQGIDSVRPEFPHTFSLGGGAFGFVKASREPTEARGASWTLRYGYTPAAPITWEIAYIGAMDVMPPDELDQDQMFATMLEANMRINIVPLASVYPFVTGGVGYGAFERREWDGSGDLDLTTMTLPVSGGIEAMIDEVSLQTRIEYRPTLWDDDVRFTGGGADSWTWIASIGARY